MNSLQFESVESVRNLPKGYVFTFKGYMVKTQKRPNTEPHGVPEALDRFVGKVIEFSTTWEHPECLEPTKKVCLLHLKAS